MMPRPLHEPADHGVGRHIVSAKSQLRPALVSVALLTLISGVVFPLALMAVGRALFPDQAAGSLLTVKGAIVGSRPIGQDFARPEYFHPRPSAAGTGYDGGASGGTNLGPSNPKLAADVARFSEAYRRLNGLPPDVSIPVDAVTRSGSGLDPDIGSENADLQVRRVARARGVEEPAVRRLVAEMTQGGSGDSWANPGSAC